MVVIALSLFAENNGPVASPTFNGSSQKLKHTQVVPVMESAVQEGANIVWCASFLSAWKLLEQDSADGPILLNGSQETVSLLNKARDPRPDLPDQSQYLAIGRKQDGIELKIKADLKKLFPAKPAPMFSGAADALIVYSYLESSIKFTLPYFQNNKPLEFSDFQGQKTKVRSFGIRPEDDYAYYKLRAQPRILFRKPWPDGEENLEFAIDLCAGSSPSQIVVARIKREATLAAAIRRVEKECAQYEALKKKSPGRSDLFERIGPNDVLLVPDLFWKVSHRFSELEGKRFANAKLKGQPLMIAQQDISFRLDRGGAELQSEAKMVCAPIPTYFVFDRPFLIYMKKRNAKEPYFAMWVENAELLSGW